MNTIKRITTRRLFQSVDTDDKPCEPGQGAYRQIPAGSEEIAYEVTLNELSLDDLARRAAGNKRGRSVSGPVTIRITGRHSPSSHPIQTGSDQSGWWIAIG